MKTITAEPFLKIETDLGEGPMWAADTQEFFWIDVTRRNVFRHSMRTGKTQCFAVSGMPGSIALRSDGTILAAFRTGLAIVSLESGQETKISSPIDFGVERFNDGKCDRRGRFFTGTMDKTMTQPIGGLYRVDADRTVTKVAGAICLSNGIAWSPDNRTLYHCDSRPGYVYAYDYDIETGTPSKRRLFLDLSSAEGDPDGCTVDAEGFLWLAEVTAGRVGRYAPDGRRVGAIELPVTRVTSVMFGGAALDTLFITTMRYGLTPEQSAAQPLAGRVFVAHPGVKGLPEPRFAG